jgi:hypothetical protein
VLGDPAVRKWAHNAPHDRHALENEGVAVRGLEDTLQWLRVAAPGIQRGYGLKEAESWALGYGARPSWLEMVGYDATVVTARGRKEKGCICGAKPCRARSSSDWLDADGVWRPHLRVEWRVFTPVQRTERRRLEITQFVPGAELPPLVWQGRTLDRLAEWWNYSAADAIRGMELVDWIRNQKPKRLEYPWADRTAGTPTRLATDSSAAGAGSCGSATQ